MTERALLVAEGIHGTFYYHMRRGLHEHFALCGDQVMHTRIPLSAWGTVTHIKERWCSRCAARALGEDARETK